VEVTSKQACPTDPLELCDFYVEGHREEVPLLTIPTGAVSDTPISGYIRDSNYKEYDHQEHYLGRVEVDSTCPARFLCPAPFGTSHYGENDVFGSSFYAANYHNKARVQIRNLEKVSEVLSRCVVLPIMSAQVHVAGSGQVTNLNPAGWEQRLPRGQALCGVHDRPPQAQLLAAVHPPITNGGKPPYTYNYGPPVYDSPSPPPPSPVYKHYSYPPPSPLSPSSHSRVRTLPTPFPLLP